MFIASSSLHIQECEIIYLDGPLGDGGVAVEARSELKNDRESLDVGDRQLGGGRGQHRLHSRLYGRHSLRPRTLHCPRAHLKLVMCRRLLNNITCYTSRVTFNVTLLVCLSLVQDHRFRVLYIFLVSKIFQITLC